MIHLIPLMIERVGIVLIAAFLFSQVKSFRKLIEQHQGGRDKVLLVLIFGLLGVVSNYTGIKIFPETITGNTWLMEVEPDSAIANTRIMGITIGGLLGGPVVGIGVGLISGIHRYFLGGFTATACAVSAVLAGGAAGYLGLWRKKRKSITAGYAVGVGVSMEAVQMLLILALTDPFSRAFRLVEVIAFPMIVVNGLGMLLFMLIIQNIVREQEKTRALQTTKAFTIADRTLPYFRKGLNGESCQEVARIMLDLTEADAIAITDSEGVLAHVGSAEDHHKPTKGFATELTKKVLKQGEVLMAKSREEILCRNEDCPLLAAVVLPLKVHGETVGTLKLYFHDPASLTEVQQQLAEGLAKLFSTQLEHADAEEQLKLLKDAEVKALQAQIHPHFLFNSINTISVLCRTQPEKARELLQELSHFFRSNLQGARNLVIPLEKEIEHVKAYLSLEQARFPDRYEVSWEVERGLEARLVPPFVLQPLVENSIRHAFTRRREKGDVLVRITIEGSDLHIRVSDNGNGIPEEKRMILGNETVPSKHGTGTALVNIKERLDGIYSHRARFAITSKVGTGTEISIRIPYESTGGLQS
ncbi:histidine kinase [Bacillus sp. Leaf406]|nr:histidine kinase [Bacillus sp. Leaf406]